MKIKSAISLQLETPRLLLRQWKESDLEPFARMSADPVVMQHFMSAITYEQSVSFVERINTCFNTNGYGLFATEIKASGEFIGFVGIWPANFESDFTRQFAPCLEIGWRLAKEYWGKGYAPEAAKRVLKFAFDDVGQKEMFSWTAKTNTNSIKVMEKIGMRRDPEQDFEHPVVPEGHHLRPHVLYRLKASDFHYSE